MAPLQRAQVQENPEVQVGVVMVERVEQHTVDLEGGWRPVSQASLGADPRDNCFFSLILLSDLLLLFMLTMARVVS